MLAVWLSMLEVGRGCKLNISTANLALVQPAGYKKPAYVLHSVAWLNDCCILY